MSLTAADSARAAAAAAARVIEKARWLKANGNRATNEAKTRFWGLIRKMTRLGAGELFGEMALLDNRPHSATAKAELPSKLFVLLRADFDASATSEAEAKAEIARTHRQSGYLLDPHTAVATHAARAALARDPATPMIVPGTAHPAKFPDAVQAATGARPPLPPHLADLMERRENLHVLANDAALVERFIRTRVGAGALA